MNGPSGSKGPLPYWWKPEGLLSFTRKWSTTIVMYGVDCWKADEQWLALRVRTRGRNLPRVIWNNGSTGHRMTLQNYEPRSLVTHPAYVEEEKLDLFSVNTIALLALHFHYLYDESSPQYAVSYTLTTKHQETDILTLQARQNEPSGPAHPNPSLPPNTYQRSTTSQS